MGDLDKKSVQQENRDKILLSARQRAEANNAARQKRLAEISAARTEELNKIQQALANKRLQDLKNRETEELNKNGYTSSYTNNQLNKLNKKNEQNSLDFVNNDNIISEKENENTMKVVSSSNNEKNNEKFDFINYDQEKSYSEVDTATIDTINNIGSFMNERIMEGVKKSLRKMDFTPNGEENTYTPIAYPTIKLAEELGIQYALSDNATSLHEAVSEEIVGVDGKTKKFNERDNSLGDAWVVNPPFQFNPNDDVRSNLSFPHFGRVFNEKINSNYPIVVFEVGTIKYNENMLNNTAFQKNDSDVGLTNRIRGGKDLGLGDVIGFPIAMVSTVLRTSWRILTFPVNALLGLRKFATFQVDTALFARYFNDISQAIATNLGLLQPIDIASSEDVDFSSSDELLNAKKVEEKLSDYINKNRKSIDNPRDIDIAGTYAGIRKRLLFETVVPGNGWGSAESDFIPFLANKDISISESISNNTQANPLAANLNAAAAEAAAAKVNNYATGSADDAAKSLIEQISSKFSHIKGGLFRGDVATVVSGEGRVTLPDMWSDSSFSRTVSLNFTFTSPYGHNLAIFENTFIPFLLLFCMASPRQIGSKTFTNPFYVRVNMKGIFSIPMGIIESLTIERGEDKNNWTTEGIPRTIKCSITIKDLSPILMMSMARSKFFSLFSGNDGLTSYINTLSGLSIHDQRDFSLNADRWYKRISERQRANTGSDSLINVITDTVNPFSYLEPLVRSNRSGFIGRTATRLSQAGLNPFKTEDRDRRNY